MKKLILAVTFLIYLTVLFITPPSASAQSCTATKIIVPGPAGAVEECKTDEPHSCGEHYIPEVYWGGAHDQCLCRCVVNPSNPPPTSSQLQCATCPGGLCDTLPCCSPCVKDVNNITGVCHCAYPPSTPDEDETLPSTPNESGDTIDTAIGPINVKSPEGFVGSILTLAIGIGGGIAILLIIFGGFQVLTSSGNPEQVKAGKEMITSAIAGLLLIIFAVFILRLIGVEILKIFE